jgi:ribonucleoside-diphosphate reductase alpha chain
MRVLPYARTPYYKCVNQEVYDAGLYDKYSKEDIEKANGYIDHDRDFLFTYAGLTAGRR